MQTEIPELSAQVVYPSGPVRRCAKCAARQWPLPAFIIRCLSLNYTNFDVHWCEGSQALTRQITVPTIVGMQKAEVDNTCAGVTGEHLHYQCRNCHWRWLQQVADVESDQWKAAERISMLETKIKELDKVIAEREQNYGKTKFELHRLHSVAVDALRNMPDDPVLPTYELKQLLRSMANAE